MNLFSRYQELVEDTTVGVYHGDNRKAVVKKTGTGRHWVMMFRNGKRSPDEDYTTAKDENDAHDFAETEMRISGRKSGGMSEETIEERINTPQGHEIVPDRISNDTKEKRGRVKKMMGNRVPMELIARILARKV